jgi:uncharacterized caspase-like protein
MKRHSLFFGVDAYADGGLRPLRCAVRDAEALAALFADADYAGEATPPVVRTNRTHDEAKRDVREFLRAGGVDPRHDLIHLHFSGHGARDDNGVFYLCFRDAVLDDLAFTAVRIAEVKDWLEARNVQRVLLTLDCCYSGAAIDQFRAGIAPDLSALTRSLPPDAAGARGWCIISAGGETELAKEGDSLSLFTRHLIEGIRTGAADADGKGWVTVADLHAHVRGALACETAGQKPLIGGQSDGPLVVALNPEARRRRAEAEAQAAARAAEDTLDAFRRRARTAFAPRFADDTFDGAFHKEFEDWLAALRPGDPAEPRYQAVVAFADRRLTVNRFLDRWHVPAPVREAPRSPSFAPPAADAPAGPPPAPEVQTSPVLPSRLPTRPPLAREVPPPDRTGFRWRLTVLLGLHLAAYVFFVWLAVLAAVTSVNPAELGSGLYIAAAVGGQFSAVLTWFLMERRRRLGSPATMGDWGYAVVIGLPVAFFIWVGPFLALEAGTAVRLLDGPLGEVYVWASGGRQPVASAPLMTAIGVAASLATRQVLLRSSKA